MVLGEWLALLAALILTAGISKIVWDILTHDKKRR